MANEKKFMSFVEDETEEDLAARTRKSEIEMK